MHVDFQSFGPTLRSILQCSLSLFLFQSTPLFFFKTNYTKSNLHSLSHKTTVNAELKSTRKNKREKKKENTFVEHTLTYLISIAYFFFYTISILINIRICIHILKYLCLKSKIKKVNACHTHTDIGDINQTNQRRNFLCRSNEGKKKKKKNIHHDICRSNISLATSNHGCSHDRACSCCHGSRRRANDSCSYDFDRHAWQRPSRDRFRCSQKS